MTRRKSREPLFDRLKSGLEAAIRHAQGEITLKTTAIELPDPPPPITAEGVARIRLEYQMSQAVFARLLNVSTSTVQSWEQGVRSPSQAALRLIQVFNQNPDGVFSIVGMRPSRPDSARGRPR